MNGQDVTARVFYDDAVLYPNPYVVVTRKGYSKHYYAGSERLASRIGVLGIRLHDLQQNSYLIGWITDEEQ